MWKWVKIPKAVALLAFLLPWMTVSCSAQKLVSATGAGIAFGRYTSEIAANRAARTTSEQIDGWVIAAIAVVLVGLVVTFASPTRRNAAIVAVTSIGGALLVWIGTVRFGKQQVLAAIARDHPGERLDLSEASRVIQVEWHIGYWLTLGALLVAAVMATLVASGRNIAVTRAPPIG